MNHDENFKCLSMRKKNSIQFNFVVDIKNSSVCFKNDKELHTLSHLTLDRMRASRIASCRILFCRNVAFTI
jgi:hypothetical protein